MREFEPGSGPVPGGAARGGGAFYHVSFRSGARAAHDYISREPPYAGRDHDAALYTESGHMPAWAAGVPAAYWDAADLSGPGGLDGLGTQRRDAVFALAAANDARTAMVFDAVRAVPGVLSVAAVGGAPLFGTPVSTGIVAAGAPARPQPALRVSVTSDYFETMGIRTVSGRTFTGESPFAGAVVVSSEFARRYLDGRAEGATFTVISLDESDRGGELRATVIGVVDDVYAGREMSGRAPVFYQRGAPSFQGIPSAMVVRLATGRRDALGVLKRRIEEAAPGTLVTMTSTFEDRLALELAAARRRSFVAGLFAAFALAIGCVAVWATVTRVGLERRREIAIRLAVGASARSVYGLLGRWYFQSAAPGLVLGAAGAFAVAQTSRSHFASSASLDAGALVAACVLLAAVHALAMVIPILRAARVEPLEVLRDG